MSLNLYQYHIQPEVLSDHANYKNRPWYIHYTINSGLANGNLTSEDIDHLKKHESIIASNANSSLMYAMYIIKKRFELGEDAIATNLADSIMYTANILLPEYRRGKIDSPRFFKGEKLLATNPHYAYEYAVLIDQEFKQGEPAIATDAECSLNYATIILDGRFELGEPAIATNRDYAYHYNDMFGTNI